MQKNRERDKYTFANVNMLGRCSAECFFCLGKDIPQLLDVHNQMRTHFTQWKNFDKFLDECKHLRIPNIYLTGQNTDPSLYPNEWLDELITHIQEMGFNCGIRTNGFFMDPDKLAVIRQCKASIGYSIHTLSPMTQKMIVGRDHIPDWDFLLSSSGNNVRVQIVVNRCNAHEFFQILAFLARYKILKYIQVRRVSTDTREKELAPDIAAYEQLYTLVSHAFPLNRKFFVDAEEYDIYGCPVVFWRTVKTSVNSMNYFTDGTISGQYFIVEGYCEENNVEL